MRTPHRATAFLLLGFLACAEGEAALERMTEPQRAYLSSRIERIEGGMGEAQVLEILGTPNRGRGTPRPCWYDPERGRIAQICVYFGPQGAFQVRWLSLWPPWVWQRRLAGTSAGS